MIIDCESLPTELRGETINIVLLDMEVPEQVTLNSDGSYTIFINARQSCDTQKHCLLHATNHILSRDWEKSDVEQIEVEAHKKDHPARI